MAKPPEQVDQVSSFQLLLDTETQSGFARVVTKGSRALIELARKRSEQERTAKSRQVFEHFLKGETRIYKVERYLRSSYVNFVDPITGNIREAEADRQQTGHVVTLSGDSGPSVLFVDDETSSAIWTSFDGLGDTFWPKIMFGHCKQVE